MDGAAAVDSDADDPTTADPTTASPQPQSPPQPQPPLSAATDLAMPSSSLSLSSSSSSSENARASTPPPPSFHEPPPSFHEPRPAFHDATTYEALHEARAASPPTLDMPVGADPSSDRLAHSQSAMVQLSSSSAGLPGAEDAMDLTAAVAAAGDVGMRLRSDTLPTSFWGHFLGGAGAGASTGAGTSATMRSLQSDVGGLGLVDMSQPTSGVASPSGAASPSHTRSGSDVEESETGRSEDSSATMEPTSPPTAVADAVATPAPSSKAKSGAARKSKAVYVLPNETPAQCLERIKRLGDVKVLGEYFGTRFVPSLSRPCTNRAPTLTRRGGPA